MQTLGCELTVERGPEWLFIRPEGASLLGRELDLADQIWGLLEQSMTYRLVLELDDIDLLSSDVISQLVMLQQRIYNQGGLMRLCGVSAVNKRAIESCRLSDYLPQYANRTQAVMGERRVKPR